MNPVARRLRSGGARSSPARQRPTPLAAARRTGWLLAWFGVLVAAGLGLHVLAGTVQGLDRRLVGDAVAIRTDPLIAVAHGGSLLGRSWLLIPLAALIGLALMRPLGIRSLSPLLAVVGADGLQNTVKALVDRPRPSVTHLEHVTGSSFPSGHATESTAFLLALLALMCTARSGLGRATAMLFAAVLACAVGASRVYLGVHYPTDVAAGIVLGGAWTAGVIRWSRLADGSAVVEETLKWPKEPPRAT
jgi:membrane-associated phospholipid phosphatase